MFAVMDCVFADIGPDPNWLTTYQAAKLLSVSVHLLRNHPHIRAVVAHKSSSARCNGLLWSRSDLDALIESRIRYGTRTNTAARMLLKNRESGFTTNL